MRAFVLTARKESGNMTYLLNTVIIVFLMWILFAFGSALFAGLTTILTKCGIRKTDPTLRLR